MSLVPPFKPAGRGAVLLFFLFVLALTVALQWVGGAYNSEFGEHADEPAHYITGLMLHDYVANLFPGSPVEYAKNYYQHYPKVGLGHWPPGYYLVQAAWTLLLTPSTWSIMALQAVLGALLATLIFVVVGRETTGAIALSAGTLLPLYPLMQLQSRQVMTEVMTALVVFLAFLCYAAYLDTSKWRYAIGFGLLAAFGLLTKGTAIVIVPLPLLSLLITRRFRLLKEPSFWVPGLLIILIAGPWYWLAPGSMHQSAMPPESTVNANRGVTEVVVPYLTRIVGDCLLPFVALGLWARIVDPLRKRQPLSGVWVVAAASIICMGLARSFVPPARALRHLLNVLPMLLMLAAAGLHWVLTRKRMERVPARWKAAASLFSLPLLALPLLLGYQLPPNPKKDCGGFGPIAERILASPEWRDSVLLVSSDARGEGMFISELAAREARPGHVILRASKVLSSSTWFGKKQQLQIATGEALHEFLTTVPVGLVVIDLNPEINLIHQSMLTGALEDSGSWELIGEFPKRGAKGPIPDLIRLYRLKDHEGKPAQDVPLQLRSDVE